MKYIVCFTIAWSMTKIEPGCKGLYSFRYVFFLWLFDLTVPRIMVNYSFYRLLKKVTKDHFRDDFDSLFKHLASGKAVSYCQTCSFVPNILFFFFYFLSRCGLPLGTLGTLRYEEGDGNGKEQ